MDEFFQPIGEFIRNNPELLKGLANSLNMEEVDSEEIVAWINAIPITLGELEFRKGLNQNAGMRSQSYLEVFNVLAEEKLVIDYAINNKILPSDDEVRQFIAEQQKQYALVFSKSFAHATEDIGNDLEYVDERETIKNQMWHELKMQLKSEANVKINKQFKELNLKLDRSKLYL